MKARRESNQNKPEIIVSFLVGVSVTLLLVKYKENIEFNTTISLSDLITLTVGGILSIYITRNIQSAINAKQFNDSIFADEVKSVLEKYRSIENLLIVNEFCLVELNRALKQANMATSDLSMICKSLNGYDKGFHQEIARCFINLRREATGNCQIHTHSAKTTYFLRQESLQASLQELSTIKQQLIRLRFIN